MKWWSCTTQLHMKKIFIIYSPYTIQQSERPSLVRSVTPWMFYYIIYELKHVSIHFKAVHCDQWNILRHTQADSEISIFTLYREKCVFHEDPRCGIIIIAVNLTRILLPTHLLTDTKMPNSCFVFLAAHFVFQINSLKKEEIWFMHRDYTHFYIKDKLMAVSLKTAQTSS